MTSHDVDIYLQNVKVGVESPYMNLNIFIAFVVNDKLDFTKTSIHTL